MPPCQTIISAAYRSQHAQTLIHLHRQRQRVRPQLHRRRAQGIGGLARIPPLHRFMALLTTTDGNIEASPDGLAHDFLLVLRFDPLDLQGAAALTVRGWRYRDHFVDFGRNGFAVPLALGGTGLASRRLRIRFAGAPRKRCGLSLIGPLRFFQLLLQLFVLLTQPFPLLPELFLFLLQLFLALLPLLLAPPQLLDFFS